MDPGTILAVICLTIQLATAFDECLSEVKGHRSAPAELQRMVDEISVLKGVLDNFTRLLKGCSVPLSPSRSLEGMFARLRRG